jgi:metal-responsive CopG/Arc/MetJ family transcriptional regulator
MKAEQLRKMFKNKSRLITMRINPELLNLLDETVKKDKEFNSRNELIETLILRYLEQRGSLK